MKEWAKNELKLLCDIQAKVQGLNLAFIKSRDNINIKRLYLYALKLVRHEKEL